MRLSKSDRFVARASGIGVLGVALLASTAGCSGANEAPSVGSGGTVVGVGGAVGQGGVPQVGAASGGSQAQAGSSQGGVTATGGVGNPSTGGGVVGGATSSGGSNSTGGVVSGGARGTNLGGAKAVGGGATGGGSSTGGIANIGGKSSGGAQTVGGKNTGGALTGGASTAGASSVGGAANGGKATGGAAMGGAAMGGAAAVAGSAATGDRCDVGVYDSASPPAALTLSGALGTHDPSAIEANGSYYLFATGPGAKTSTNLTTWSDAPRPFVAPSWLTSAVSGVTDLWAADISYFGGKYHLYYAGSTFGTNKSCIGHATKTALNSGTWTDQGSATICSNVTTSGDNWNAIDPAVVLDVAGTPWMAFGSFWGGIKLIQLDQNGARVGTTLTSIAARPSNGGAIEGPYIVRRCGYYYLFTSWDKCCDGANSTYSIHVARSTSITGPYVDQSGTTAMTGGGTLIAAGNSTWKGPGGQSAMVVGNKAYLVYHAYAASNGSATLRIADLVWDAGGWPLPVGP